MTFFMAWEQYSVYKVENVKQAFFLWLLTDIWWRRKSYTTMLIIIANEGMGYQEN